MKKIKVIIGKNGSGKSFTSIALVSSVNRDEKTFLKEEYLKDPFCFSMCSKKTKVVIIDELRNPQYLLTLIFSSVDGIIVNKRGQKPFEIYPEMIIVCCEDITKERLLDMGSSILRRIEIIETIS
jgi:ABC-type dipeptide/oligopeptide/nickel transport system ATPase component